MEVKLFRVSNGNVINQCYLVHDQQAGLLVDPAWDYDLICDFLTDHEIRLTGILLTHSHYDHIDLAAVFALRYHVPVYMSATEISMYSFNCLNLVPVVHMQAFDVDRFRVNPIVTPGHTAGSTCYQVGGHCFTGDTIFIEGVGACDAADASALYDSVQLIKGYLNKHTLIWPGHSFGETPGKTLDFLMANNLYFQLEERALFTHFRMRKNRPDPQLFR